MKKFLDHLTQIERIACAIMVAILTILVIGDVFSRELFKIGIPWAQKSAVYLMVWSGFIGAILMAHKAEHLRPEMGDKLWKGSMRLIAYRIQQLIVLIFCLGATYYSYQYVVESKELADVNVILGIPMWYLQVILPYTFASMSLRYLYFLINPSLPTGEIKI
jgi:TRAP-type C4-dicarboxylate transport system permease small subunit